MSKKRAVVRRPRGRARVLRVSQWVVAGAAAAAAHQATGTVYTWDPNGSAGLGGTNNWDLTDPYWSTTGGPTASPVDWMNGSSNIAVFAGTAGTVTLTSKIQAGGLTFNVGGYTLNASSTSNTLNLASGSVITTNGGTTTFSTALSLVGAGGTTILKTGPGTLALNTTNGNLGTAANPAVWTVAGGTFNTSLGAYDSVLSIGAGNNLGAAPTTAATQVILNAGTLQLTGTGLSPAIGATRTIQVNASGGAIIDSNGNPFLGAITDNAGSNASLYLLNGSGTTNFNGSIGGTGGITVSAGGAIALNRVGSTATNTYTGPTVVNAGVLELNYNTAASTSAITVNTGGELSTLGSQITNAVTVNGGALSWDLYSGSGDYQGPVTLGAGGGTVVLTNFYGSGSAESGTVSGVIGGSGGLAVTATSNINTSAPGTPYSSYGATLTLSGANSYTGGTTLGFGTTTLLKNAAALGANTNSLTASGQLFTNGYNVATGALTLNGYGTTGGAAALPTTNTTGAAVAFNVGAGAINTLTAGSATMSGTTGIQLNNGSSSSITPGTYALISSPNGGLSGNVVFNGGQVLTVPATTAIENIGGTNYKLTLATTGTAVNVTVAAATGRTLNVMPLGSSITAGQSAQVEYDGGGYRSQLYQNLVNDGRFTPVFQGSSTANLANNPTGTDLMTAVGQAHHEGHPGYTTTQTLGNLNANDGSGGNDGGFWLKPGNGVDPSYVTLNIGGNDFVANATDTTAITRLNQIVSQIATLRPNATTVVSSILYRSDGSGKYGAGVNAYYNPYIPSLVYQQTLAGNHVSFLDLYGLITPNNDTSLIGPDGVHPVQAGYDLIGNDWYQAMTTGQAFYTGAAGGALTTTNGSTTNWAMDFTRATDSGVNPTAGTDVYFNGGGGGGTLALGADLSVRSVNFAAGATTPINIGGSNTLTLGSGGITVQAGTAAHTISSAVSLAAAQSWSSVASNAFTVSGAVSGSGPLTIGGTGKIVVSGANTYTGGTTLIGGTLVAANTTGSATGTGPVTVAAAGTLPGLGTATTGGTLAGTGTVAGPVAVSGTITAGSGATTADAIGTLTTGGQTWNASGGYTAKVASDGTATANDQLVMSSLSLTSSTTSPFTVTALSIGSTSLPATAQLILAIDSSTGQAGVFANAITARLLTLSNNSTVSFSDGSAAMLSEMDVAGTGAELVLESATAAPEPTSLLLAAVAAGPLVFGRRRRRN